MKGTPLDPLKIAAFLRSEGVEVPENLTAFRIDWQLGGAVKIATDYYAAKTVPEEIVSFESGRPVTLLSGIPEPPIEEVA